MALRIIKVSPESPEVDRLKVCADIIKRGGLVAFPTETVYGLGCDGLNEKAVERLYRVKRRKPTKPVILHVHTPLQVEEVAEVNEVARALMDEFFPGPLALVLKKRRCVPDVTSGYTDKIAVRMPANRIALKLIELSETVIAAPSANRSGGISPTRAEDVVEEFGDEIDAVVDGGETEVGIESTVLDLSEDKKAVVLRLGAITLEELEEALSDYEVELLVPSKKLEGEHYRVRGRVIIADPSAIPQIVAELLESGLKVGVCAFEEVVDEMLESIDAGVAGEMVLFRVRDEEDYSKKLFRAMREMRDCDYLVFQSVRESGIGRAIMARLREAEKAGKR